MRDDEHVQLLSQISVFLENRPGRLSEVVSGLAAAGVNLRALMIAETERFGILRIIPDNLPAARGALTEVGITHRVSPVIGVEVPDRAGGLAELLGVFDGTDVSIEYMYAELAGRGDRALMIMKFDPADEALRLLVSSELY